MEIMKFWMKLKNTMVCVMLNVPGNFVSNYNKVLLFLCCLFFCYRDVVLYAASANRKYVDNIIKVLADVVLRPRITEDEVKKYI